jgi:hypothetical protein
MVSRFRNIRRPGLYTVLFFVLLTLIGLCTVRGYGATYDELTETQIMQSSIKEYALQLNPGGDGFFAKLNVARASESNDREYGNSAYYLLAPFLPRLVPDTGAFSLMWSVLTWLWFMLGCAALYGFLRILGLSRPAACAGVLLLYLMPRFFAEGHYNNKDMVMLSLVLITLYFGARLMIRPGFASGLLFALSAAIATNTRIIGAFVFGLTGLMVLVSVSVNRRWDRRVVCVACAAVAGYLCFYWLLTPAMWSDPLEQLRVTLHSASSFSRWNNTIIFRGAEFPDPNGATPLPFYYLPYLMLTTIPLYTTLLAIIGFLAMLIRALKNKRSRLGETTTLLLITAALTALVPLFYAAVMRPMVYNGWRHFYFTYAGPVILAGYGMGALLRLVRKKKALRIAAIALLAGCLLFTGAGMILNHPYQFAYYNVLIPRNRGDYMELDYWNVGFAGAFRQLYDLKKDTGEALRIGCYFNDIAVGTFKLPDSIASRLVITTERDAPYLCYNATYAHIYRVKEPPEGYHVLFTVQSYGNTIITMYERDAAA